VNRKLLLLIVSVVLVTSAGFQGKPADADLILTNARVWTGDAARPWAEALAIQGNKIIKVASSAEVRKSAAQGTQIIDLGGKLVIPGFNDAHTHFLSGSMGFSQVDLVGTRSLAEVQQRVVDFARAHPEEKWITGAGWEYSIFPEKRLPTRADLDAVVRDRPVFLRAYDGHTGWANSKALELARVTRASKFQGYGELVLDPKTGEPTGVLKESAQGLVRGLIPAPSEEKKLNALRQGFRLVASLGITSFQNASGSPEELALYEKLRDRSELTTRVSIAMSVGEQTADREISRDAELKRKFPGPLLRVGAVKIILDGVIEAHTAAMIEPYSDQPATSGSPSLNQTRLNELVALADKAGLQVYIHAIGDRAVRMALDAYEHARMVNGVHDSRFRIEHIETIASSDIPRFARLGVLASMEPIHADPGTNEVWEPAVGPERARRGFAWRSLEKAGAQLIFSSDWPATISVDPMRGLHNAINRRTIDGQPPGGWIPQERVSLESALRAYTCNAAYASFEEKIKGTLAEGMLADVAVLSQDLFRIDPMDIYKTNVVMTIFDGKVVYR
jgi:predicted amidohydrolase YtcJ